MLFPVHFFSKSDKIRDAYKFKKKYESYAQKGYSPILRCSSLQRKVQSVGFPNILIVISLKICSETKGIKLLKFKSIRGYTNQAKTDKKDFFNKQYRETEENSRRGKTRNLLKKMELSRGTFYAKLAQ